MYLQVELDPEVRNDDASMADAELEHESTPSGEPSLHNAPTKETIPEDTPTSIAIWSQSNPLLFDEIGTLIDSIINLPVPQGDIITKSTTGMTMTEQTTTIKLSEKVQA